MTEVFILWEQGGDEYVTESLHSVWVTRDEAEEYLRSEGCQPYPEGLWLNKHHGHMWLLGQEVSTAGHVVEHEVVV